MKIHDSRIFRGRTCIYGFYYASSQNIGLDYVWSFIVIHINIGLNFDMNSNVNLHDAVILHSPDSIHGKFPAAPRSVISVLHVVTRGAFVSNMM